LSFIHGEISKNVDAAREFIVSDHSCQGPKSVQYFNFFFFMVLFLIQLGQSWLLKLCCEYKKSMAEITFGMPRRKNNIFKLFLKESITKVTDSKSAFGKWSRNSWGFG